MEKVSIYIKKLGAIEESEVSLNKLVLISGESGLGKSYLAALCNYLFHTLSQPFYLNRLISEKIGDEKLDKLINYSILKSDFENWLSEDARRHLCFLFNNENMKIDISISLPIKDLVFYSSKITEEVDGTLRSFNLITLNQSLSYKSLDVDNALESWHPFTILILAFLKKSVFGDNVSISNFILPPSRGTAMSEDVKSLSGMFGLFSAGMQSLRASQPLKNIPETELLQQFRRILEGDVAYSEDSKSYIYTTDRERLVIPLSAAASSIKELAPIAMFVSRRPVKNASFLIEEPEAHLHPQKQRMVADILSLLLANGAFLQITTHSDYLLRRLDELVTLDKIRLAKPECFSEACKKVDVLESTVLPYKNISAYLLERNANGSVSVKLQNLANGIDFESFYNALKQNVENSYYLSSVLEDE